MEICGRSEIPHSIASPRFHGVLAPIGPANGTGLRLLKARPARGRRTSATDAVLCMVANLQDPRRRMAWRGLQRLVRPMGSTPRRSGQRPSVLQSRAGRCGPSWLSLRHGSWTTVTWTRTGAKIGNYSRGPRFTILRSGLLQQSVIADSQNAEGGDPGSRPALLGPWAFIVCPTNSFGSNFIGVFAFV